jgi:hypothetical protein
LDEILGPMVPPLGGFTWNVPIMKFDIPKGQLQSIFPILIKISRQAAEKAYFQSQNLLNFFIPISYYVVVVILHSKADRAQWLDRLSTSKIKPVDVLFSNIPTQNPRIN